MKRHWMVWLLIGSLLFLSACASNEQEKDTAKEMKVKLPVGESAETVKEYFIRTEISAPSLGDSLIGESVKQTVSILLPPSYYESDKKYPVVYFLHGYQGSTSEILRLKETIKTQMTNGKLKEFIVVAVNGLNKHQGNFYTNSIATGNWEQHMIDEIIPHMDTTYRTITQTQSRGIAGFSMGGSGAINLSLKHPDQFGVVYAISPGLFNEQGLEDAFATWNAGFKIAYGAAFSPNKDVPMFAEIPTFDGSAEDQRIVANWENGYGNLKAKIEAYLKHDAKLKAIRFEVGGADNYRWIPPGTKYFSELLTEYGIAHEYNRFNGDHMNMLSAQLVSSMLPFFSEQLAQE